MVVKTYAMLPPAVLGRKCLAAATDCKAFPIGFQEDTPSTRACQGWGGLCEGGSLEHLLFASLVPSCLLLLWLLCLQGHVGQRQSLSEGIQLAHGRHWITKGCSSAPNPTPRFPLPCLDQRGLRPWCLEGPVPWVYGVPALAPLHCRTARGKAPPRADRCCPGTGNSVESWGKAWRQKTTVGLQRLCLRLIH